MWESVHITMVNISVELKLMQRCMIHRSDCKWQITWGHCNNDKSSNFTSFSVVLESNIIETIIVFSWKFSIWYTIYSTNLRIQINALLAFVELWNLECQIHFISIYLSSETVITYVIHKFMWCLLNQSHPSPLR